MPRKSSAKRKNTQKSRVAKGRNKQVQPINGLLTPLHRFSVPHLLIAAVVMATLGGYMVYRTFAETAGTVSGKVFMDNNRNGVFDTGDESWSGKLVYLFSSTGTYLKNVPTDSTGNYTFNDIALGEYKVEYDRVAWTGIWENLAPTTTGSEWPRHQVNLTFTNAASTLNFGWRNIIRSNDINAPISSYVAPSGLKVHSYNDVLTAQYIYESLMNGSLFGSEAALTTLRFDLNGPGDQCVSSSQESGGVYSNFIANCQFGYLRWLDLHDYTMFHEYGHAWSSYYAMMVQQDTRLTGYLEARGIDPSDPRLGTSHAWNSGEMIAEDYRQLFGSPTAAKLGQENQDIPAAKDVPGLKEYLSGDFMHKSGVPPPPPPTPDTQAPTPPSNLRSTAITANRITLTWNSSTDNVGVKEYHVYLKQTSGKGKTAQTSWKKLATTTGTTYTHSGLKANTTYEYFVVAVDTAGNESLPSSTLSAKTARR